MGSFRKKPWREIRHRRPVKKSGIGIVVQRMLFSDLSFLTSSDKEMVLVLSGDHVYYMDYRPMMEFHRDNKAHVTIGIIPVPWEDTPQFGTSNFGRKTTYRRMGRKVSPGSIKPCFHGYLHL